MNSQQLINEYPETYLEFASDADEIFKIPHTISLFWWTACVMWWVVVEQKIPLSCYVSIKSTKNWKITVGKYLRFNPNISKFEQLDTERFESPRITFADALQQLYPNASYEISVLNEIPNKTPDAVAFLSILALEHHENANFSMEKFYLERQHPYESKFIRDLIRKSESARLKYNETTMGLSSMSSTYCALHCDTDTIIHKTEARLPLPRKDEAHTFSQSNERKFSGASIRKILWEIWKMPFEMIVLTPRNTEKNSHWYWELANNILGAEAISCEIDIATQASGNWLSRRRSLTESMEMIVACSEMLTLNAINAIRKHYEWKIIESELFWLLNKAHDWSRHLLWKSNLENSSSEARLIRELSKSVEESTKWEYLIFRTGSSIDMNYVILVSRKIPYEEMLSIIEGLKRNLSKEFNILLSTVADKSIDLEIKTVSKKELLWNAKNDGIEVRSLWDNTWKYIGVWFLEYASWHDGIVIDGDTWKIYANWVRATSKELPSQQFTTEVFIRLVNLGAVKSCDLPLSTYSTSKNETISKILNPFRKYLTLHTWADIEWLVDWSEADFQFKIKNVPVGKIVVVKRIMQE